MDGRRTDQRRILSLADVRQLVLSAAGATKPASNLAISPPSRPGWIQDRLQQAELVASCGLLRYKDISYRR